jgi:hypothetical protein
MIAGECVKDARTQENRANREEGYVEHEQDPATGRVRRSGLFVW